MSEGEENVSLSFYMTGEATPFCFFCRCLCEASYVSGGVTDPQMTGGNARKARVKQQVNVYRTQSSRNGGWGAPY